MVDRVPRATYRVQLHAGFTFDDAAAIVPYLAELGISHVYASPILQSMPGSNHGYDVVDHSRVSDERGGVDGLRRLVSALDAHGMGLVVDVVPNHMAADGRANPWWWDVLENGPASQHASAFDIDWDPPESKLRHVVLAPILGDHYGRELEAGRIRLARERGSFVIRYFDHELPVSPRSLDDLLAAAAEACGSAELAVIADGCRALPPASATDRESVRRRHRDKEVLRAQLARLCDDEPSVAKAIDEFVAHTNASPDALDALLVRQNYRLAWWRVAGEELDYRRFFDIPSLVALRMEDEAVFAETHTLLLGLVAEGAVQGLRIDHPDGLRDPQGYLDALADATDDAWVIVEKILEPGERLRDGWRVAGTTGYEWLNIVTRVFVDAAGEGALDDTYADFLGTEHREPFSAIASRAKREVMARDLAADVERLTELCVRLCELHRRHRDHTRGALREAMRELIAAMPVYRTYVRAGQPADAVDAAIIDEAVATAGRNGADLDRELVAFLGDVLALRIDGPIETELALRFQQTTSPVMAKGVEDTAFYRDLRLVSLCEVGGWPDQFSVTIDDFHAHNRANAECWPHTLLTTSTHDTKRSDDVRARIGVLSEIPSAWCAAVDRWSQHNAVHHRGLWPDRATEYLLYQTLVGAWPIHGDRLVAYLEKATREAKVHTSWVDPHPAYEAAVAGFARDVLADEQFVADFSAFLAPVVEAGRTVALAQTLLKLTCPGIPDLYQGSELWDLSLVDPDNRRPVDFDVRRQLLRRLSQSQNDVRGGPKLSVVRHALALRAERPDVFGAGSSYVPLPAGEHAIAFRRSDDVVVVVPRLVCSRDAAAGDTVELPTGRWFERFTGATYAGGSVALGSLFREFPVALLVRDA